MTVDTTLKLTDLLTIVATLLSPFIAVQASEFLRARAAAREARERVFHILMSTRSARLSTDHVAALNRIDLVFPPQKFSGVSDAWNMYLRELSPSSALTEEQARASYNEQTRLFLNLLSAMAAALKVPFSQTALQHNAYHPQGYVFNEAQAAEFRAAVISVLKGEQAIAVKPDPSLRAGGEETAPRDHPGN
ncbi:DUF6680 family protein [Variovorax sp. PAMC26660]|uniref:DUF6680 family protein n=1 Tax=Variovorax sp. PAMC26660 TaxID=2762322 RepID=UPI00164ECFCA|nr:DUF6680 family protein [Variovorax sp. PAMC26660]QNK69181.1 hypothetical protein H7F35_05560 [Variovorax sp. PAMC26660]